MGALLAGFSLSLAPAATPAARSVRERAKPAKRSPIHEFLVRNGVPIDGRIQVARLSAVVNTRDRVRSVVKVVNPRSLPHQDDIEGFRKRIREKIEKGEPVRFDASKIPTEIGLLRENILAGEVIEFHPSEKLGELELFFSKTQSLKIQIGHDMFYIRIGDKDCTFSSPSLARQLKNILER